MPGSADRSINMALRVRGIGEVERDFARVGKSGQAAFERVEKAANGADREMSEYTARLKRVAAAAREAFDATPGIAEARAASPGEYFAARNKAILDRIEVEKRRMQLGLPDMTQGFSGLGGAVEASGGSLLRFAGLAAGAGTAALALVQGVMAATEAFMEHERALDSFHASLALAGNQSNATAGEIEKMAQRVVASTLQTEEGALKAAQTLATVPNITKEGLEDALDASARLADALGTDVAQQAESTAVVLRALAEHDMRALYEATDGLNAPLRVMVLRLAEAGKTADAQKAYLDGLRIAAGDGPDGLTSATNRLSKAWDRFKQSAGEDFAGPIATALDTLSGLLEKFEGKTNLAAGAWNAFKNVLPLGMLLPVLPEAKMPPGQQTGGGGLFGGVGQMVERVSNAAANAAANGALKAFDQKYGSDSPKANTISSGTEAKLGDMVATLKAILPGVRITSTTGGQHVKGSDHYAGRAVDFVPAGGMGQFSKAQIRQMLLDAGVDIRRNGAGVEQFFGPGDKGHSDHFHVAWQGSAPDPNRAIAAQQREAQRLAEAQQRDAQQARAAADTVEAANDDVVASYALRAKEAEEKIGLEGEALKAVERRQALDAIVRRINREEIDKEIAARRAAATAAGQQFDEAGATREATAAVEAKSAALREYAMREMDAADAIDDFARKQAYAKSILEGLMTPLDRLNEQVDQAIDALRAGGITADQFDQRMDQLARGFADVAHAADTSAQAWEGFGQDVGRTLSNIALNGGSAMDILQQLIRLPLERLLQQNVANPVAHWIDSLTGNNTDRNIAAARAGLPDPARVMGAGVSVIDPAATGAATSLTAVGTSGMTAAQALNAVALSAGNPIEDLAIQTDSAAQAMGGLVPVTGQFGGVLAQAIAMLSSMGGGGGGTGGLISSLLSIGASALGGGAGPKASLLTDVNANIAANPGLFASGTDRLPVGQKVWLGENGRELAEAMPGGGLRVYSNQHVRRMAETGGGGLTIIQTNHIPERADPRRTASGIARSTQGALARAGAKGLAIGPRFGRN